MRQISHAAVTIGHLFTDRSGVGDETDEEASRTSTVMCSEND